MIRQDYKDMDGRAVKSKATPMKWGNTNININVGFSNQQIKEQLEIESERYETYAPWNRNNWQIQYRNPIKALEILCLDHLESDCTEGYSNYHYTMVDENEIQNTTVETANEWGIPYNEPHYVWSLPLGGSAKGDDANVDKVHVHKYSLIIQV